MSNDETRNVVVESVSQLSGLDTPSSDGLADFLSEDSLSAAAPERTSLAPQSPDRPPSARQPVRLEGPPAGRFGQPESAGDCDDLVIASADTDNAPGSGPRGQLAAALAAVLVCSVAASALWLHHARSADRELTALPSPPVLAQALAPPDEAVDTPIVDATENTDAHAPPEWTIASGSDAHRGGAPIVEAARPTREVGATFPLEVDPGARVRSAAIPADGALHSRVIGAMTPTDRAPSSRGTAPTMPVEVAPGPRVTNAPIALPPARTEAGSAPDATLESGASAASLPGAIAAPRTPIPDVASSVSDEDRSGVERTLERYQRAYRELDAPAAAALWPTVDARALRRAFASVQEQDLVFQRCDIATTPDAATAHCVGEVSYVRRVGDTTRRAEHHTWTIRLLRSGKEWSVVGLSAH